MRVSPPQNRGISPVIGAILMLAITVALAMFAASFFLGLTDETDPQPNVVLSDADAEDTTHRLVHDGGETLDGDQLELQGALDSDAAAGKRLADGDEIEFYPIAEEITVIWHGDNDESYQLTTLTVEQALPVPDIGCEEIEDRTDGGTDGIKIDDEVVNCDVRTNEGIEVSSGGVVIGKTISDTKDLDIDDGEVYGDVTTEKVINVQEGQIRGDATSEAADVVIDNSGVNGGVTAEETARLENGATVGGHIHSEKIAKVLSGSSVDGSVTTENKNIKVEDGTVQGRITAGGTVEVQKGATVGGDVQSKTANANIQSGSVIEGSLTAGGTVKLNDVTVKGHVYTDDLKCSDSTINGEDCDSYDPKDSDEF